LEEKELLPKAKINKTLWILITSSTGMCGGFNISNLKDFVLKINKEDSILCFGSRGLKFLNRNGFEKNIIKYQHIADKNFSYFQLSYINKLILQLYNKGVYTNIKIQYISLVNSFSTKPKTIQLFPLVL
jgi:F-type H+-transporting ATPase subunit gamma